MNSLPTIILFYGRFLLNSKSWFDGPPIMSGYREMGQMSDELKFFSDRLRFEKADEGRFMVRAKPTGENWTAGILVEQSDCYRVEIERKPGKVVITPQDCDEDEFDFLAHELRYRLHIPKEVDFRFGSFSSGTTADEGFSQGEHTRIQLSEGQRPQGEIWIRPGFQFNGVCEEVMAAFKDRL